MGDDIHVGGEFGQDEQHLDLLPNLELEFLEALEVHHQFCESGSRVVAIWDVGINKHFELHVNGGD